MSIVNKKRIRRPPEEARTLILAAAEQQLNDAGLDGLTVQKVAAVAGISHASVIHHFGSTEEMRKALYKSLSESLLTDIHRSLIADMPAQEILSGLFDAMSNEGHSKLLAWDALSSSEGSVINADLFRDILNDLDTSANSRHDARMVVMLVTCAALGFSVGGQSLKHFLGVTDDEMSGFSQWLSDLLTL